MRLPYAQETLAIRQLNAALLTDVNLLKAVNILKLTKWLELLKTANEEFQALIVNRTKDNAEVTDRTTLELRKEIVTLFDGFRDRVKAHDILKSMFV